MEARKDQDLGLGLERGPGAPGQLGSPKKVAKERADRQEEWMTLEPRPEAGVSPGRPELTVPDSWFVRKTVAAVAAGEEGEAGRPRSDCGRGSWQTRQDLSEDKKKNE